MSDVDPFTVDVDTAADLLGIGRRALYEAFRDPGWLAAGPHRLYPIHYGSNRIRVGRRAIELFCAAYGDPDGPVFLQIATDPVGITRPQDAHTTTGRGRESPARSNPEPEVA